jgi:hypothetical protein
MGSVVYEACNVVLGHLGELLLKKALESGEQDVALAGSVVINDAILNLSPPLFEDGWLGASD